MNHRNSAVIAALALTLAAAPSLAGEPSPLSSGKDLFEKSCATCHTLEKPLAVQADRAGWEAQIKRMVANGAKLDESQTSLILGYLTAKSAFETKCNACHNLDKPLAAIKDPKQWQETVKRMAAMPPGAISEADAGAIALYLSLVTPVAPAAAK